MSNGPSLETILLSAVIIGLLVMVMSKLAPANDLASNNIYMNHPNCYGDLDQFSGRDYHDVASVSNIPSIYDAPGVYGVPDSFGDLRSSFTPGPDKYKVMNIENLRDSIYSVEGIDNQWRCNRVPEAVGEGGYWAPVRNNEQGKLECVADDNNNNRCAYTNSKKWCKTNVAIASDPSNPSAKEPDSIEDTLYVLDYSADRKYIGNEADLTNDWKCINLPNKGSWQILRNNKIRGNPECLAGEHDVCYSYRKENECNEPLLRRQKGLASGR